MASAPFSAATRAVTRLAGRERRRSGRRGRHGLVIRHASPPEAGCQLAVPTGQQVRGILRPAHRRLCIRKHSASRCSGAPMRGFVAHGDGQRQFWRPPALFVPVTAGRGHRSSLGKCTDTISLMLFDNVSPRRSVRPRGSVGLHVARTVRYLFLSDLTSDGREFVSVWTPPAGYRYVGTEERGSYGCSE